MAATQTQPNAVPDGLRYYILRGNVMVPLVPADQLPFQLEGVPRQLSHRQMSDECWKLLKETDHVATPLGIRKPLITSAYQHAPVAKSRFLAPDHQVRIESTAETERSQPTDQHTLPQKAVTPPFDPRNISPPIVHKSSSSLVDTFASIYHKDAQRLGYRMPYPSGIEPDPSKKEFCTHWIKTGECAFISVGCKYKHEMPSMDRLRGLGFTQLPRWWKEKSAVTTRGPTWMQRRLAAGNEDSKDGDDTSDPRIFPDPSTFTSRHGDDKSLQIGETSLRTRLHQPSIIDSAINSRPPTPIAHSNKMTYQHTSQVSNLLIDLDESPTVPLSPQLSDRFLTSASIVDTEPSCIAAPAKQSPKSAVITEATNSSVHLRSDEEKLKEQDVPQQPVAQQDALISLAPEAVETVTTVDLVHEHEMNTHKSECRSPAPSGKSGLADSKHATADSHKSRRIGMDKRDDTSMAMQVGSSRIRLEPKAKQAARWANKSAKQQHVKRGPSGTRAVRGVANADPISRA